MNINNNRPGVYSSYEISSALTQSKSAGYAGLAAVSASGDVGQVQVIETAAQGLAAFGEDAGNAHMMGCVRVLLSAGVSRICAVSVKTGGNEGTPEEYASALAALAKVDNVSAIVCDGEGASILAKVKEAVVSRSENRREAVAYCPAAAENAVTLAKGQNCERIVLCTPASSPVGYAASHPVYTAAALAGMVLAKNDPVYSFSGEPFTAIEAVEELEESLIQDCLAAGVTVFENVEGTAECVRALTTKTSTGGAEDKKLAPLNAILIIDHVMTTVRSSLKRVLRGVRTTSMDIVASQVAVDLAAIADLGILESFETPVAYSLASDPSVCVVELAFKTAYVVNQIHVTAHIQV